MAERPKRRPISASAEAIRRDERERVRAMSARERVYLALELGRRAGALATRATEPPAGRGG